MRNCSLDVVGLSCRPPLLPDTVVEEIIARVNNQIITQGNTCAARSAETGSAAVGTGECRKIVADKDRHPARFDRPAAAAGKGKDPGITAPK
jgi:hypothetical protein